MFPKLTLAWFMLTVVVAIKRMGSISRILFFTQWGYIICYMTFVTKGTLGYAQ